MTRTVIILWVVVVKHMLIALQQRQATGNSDGEPKFCLIKDTAELKMRSSVIIASGFTGRQEEYVGCVTKFIVYSKYLQLFYGLRQSNAC